MTRDELYTQWERLHDRGTRTPAYWAAVAAIVRWDEDAAMDRAKGDQPNGD